jgi:hypothetical protein
MATVRAPKQLTVDDVMAAVKQLTPVELRAFTNQFKDWQAQIEGGVEEEAALLACITENSQLLAAEQRRFNHYRRKRQAETLTPGEAIKLRAIWRRVERMNAARLEALGQLAKQRGTDVRTLMHELGLTEKRDVF